MGIQKNSYLIGSYIDFYLDLSLGEIPIIILKIFEELF